MDAQTRPFLGDQLSVFEVVGEHQPDAVVCATYQRVAVSVLRPNGWPLTWMMRGLVDNKGQQPLDTVIQADGAPAWFHDN